MNKERLEKPRWKFLKDSEERGDNQTWIYKEGKWDFWFVDIVDEKWVKKGFYVHMRNKKDAMDGDEVSFFTKVFKGKEEAQVVKVLKRARRIIVWLLEMNPKWYGFVVPNNPSIKSDIFIHPKNFWKAKSGQVVWVEIIEWSGRNPEGKIVQVLGKTGDKWLDVFALALEWGARIEFPHEVELEAKNAVLKHFWTSRRDLTKLFTFTIDGEDAKDLDDAISLEKKPNGNYLLYVHIADVTHYVRENSALDKEALERGTSIYLTDRVIPMLPEELSNGVCSLNAHEEKATLTCEMEIDLKGNVVGSNVYESLIKSSHRLTYNIVEKIKQNNFLPSEEEIDEKWFELSNKNKDKMIEGLTIAQKDLKLLWILKYAFDLKAKIESHRRANGYLEFDFYEAKIEVDPEGNIINIKKRDKLDANKLIEHFMVNANEAVGRKFSMYPFLYRIHPDPNEEEVEKAVRIIKKYIASTGKSDAPKVSGDISIENAIILAKWHNFLSRIILRSLTKALYSEKNEWHFWLGLDFYSHFTSPIRRYPDLQIHRIIKEKLSSNLNATRITHYKQILPGVAKQCSHREQLSEDIERKVEDLAKVKFMWDKIGQIFQWEISGMIPKWCFVELDSTVEGFIDIQSLGRGNFTFLEEALQLKNLITWEVFTFWDTVKVKLRSVDLKMRRIDFELLAEAGKEDIS